MFIEQGYIQRINLEIFNRFGYYNYHLIHWTASWLLGITYVTNIKGSHYPSSTDEMMHFFDPNLTLFLCSFLLFFTMGDLLRGALLAQSDNALRDYIKTKIDWNGSFSFFYGQFYHCFYVTFFSLLI
jgi:hypothetical protein